MENQFFPTDMKTASEGYYIKFTLNLSKRSFCKINFHFEFYECKINEKMEFNYSILKFSISTQLKSQSKIVNFTIYTSHPQLRIGHILWINFCDLANIDSNQYLWNGFKVHGHIRTMIKVSSINYSNQIISFCNKFIFSHFCDNTVIGYAKNYKTHRFQLNWRS